MARFQEIAGWLLSSLGVALLVCSLVLVPTSAVMGQGHGGGGGHGAAICVCNLDSCKPLDGGGCCGGFCDCQPNSCGCALDPNNPKIAQCTDKGS